ncbi:HD domain-containing protein [Cellulomonas alba]|uniref:HD domain-containing protein n=1 Tax=Cellulomonas alba TaxID=3053467 RepID=UPI002DD65E38|nr:hypothetical protein [Cellulomonas alba]
MGVHDAPQWLLSSFQRSVVGAGGTASTEQIREAGQSLIDRWTAPGRTFHNLKHLVDVLARVDELVEETHEPDLVRLAAWYHGAIFDSADRKAYANRGGEDEIASARLAYEELTALGVSEARARRVHDLVVALVRHAPNPNDVDCAVLCDADLAMLASEPQKYKAYLLDVRAEYAHLPARDFVRARLRILDKLLGRPTLFSSPLGAAWEEPARQNLLAERHRLAKELAILDAEAGPDAPDLPSTMGATSDGAPDRALDGSAPAAEPSTAPSVDAPSTEPGDPAGRTHPAA